MKLIATLIASAFAVTAFAAEPAKKEEVKAPTAVTVPAPTATKPAKPASAPAKADATKSVPAKAEDKKAEAPKK